MTKLSIVLGVLALALAGTAVDAAETFTVTATFENDDFALGELSARLDFCTSTIMQSGTDAARADCVKNLISASAHCYSQAGEFLCNIGGVVLNTKDISFQCAGGNCPSAVPDLKTAMDTAHSCTGSTISVAGFTAVSNCYSSAYCLYDDLTTDATGFGEFCPSSTGEFCCSITAARDNGYFQSVNPVFSSTDASYRHIDHVVDMDFSIAYDVQAPAKLQLKVTVPYVTATSQITYVENGNSVNRTMCPTTYLIDFLPPVETEPKSGDGVIDPPAGRVGSWLPLSHFPAEDLVGRPRTSCAAYGMNYGDANAFNTGFGYPTGNSGDFTYGNVLATDAANWNTSSGVNGIPYDTVTFWNKGAAPSPSDPQTIEYTVGDGPTGYFDLVRVWTQCKNLRSNANNAQVVTKDAEVEDIYINGVRYEVESYSWTLSVCAVGWYGPQCDTQMYAKTCRSIPASFSVTPQQIAHVAIAPVTSQLVSKTFLQSVDAFPSDCAILSERVAVTLNLVIFGTDYEIKTDSVHDVLAPTGILDTVNQEDLTITSVTGFTDFASYAAAEATAGRAVPAGVFVMDKRTVSSGGTSVYYRKIVVVTKCYQTDYNPERGTRDSPSVFADDIAGSDDHVLFDVEVILSNTTGLPGGTTDITNTLNLRVLATKDTFVLPTASELKQKDATAYQALYGSYASAALDTAVNHPLKLPSGTQMRGGDQVCSKHQLVDADAVSTNLIPNAVGSCMLKKTLPSKFSGVTPGDTIKYKVPGGDVTDYTYGCFPDWIDLTGITASIIDGESVYEFSGPVVRQLAGEVHDSIFWFVQKQELEETQLIAGEKMSDRFGTALFWFDMNAGSYVVTKSDQFQTLVTDFNGAVNPNGCANTVGAQKSSCNLVCFDLVDSLLTDPDASSDRQVLVHHVSVATIANESHTVVGNKLTGAKKHRRTLLESVTPTVRTSESLSAGITTLAVAPGPNQVAVNAAGDSGPRDVDGPKNFAAIFFPIAFVLIFASMTVVGCFCATRRYPTKSLFRSFNAGSKRGGLEERLMDSRR